MKNIVYFCDIRTVVNDHNHKEECKQGNEEDNAVEFRGEKDSHRDGDSYAEVGNVEHE